MLSMPRNGWERFLRYASLVLPTLWIIYQILYTGFLTEPQKYLVLTAALSFYIVGYLKFVIEPRLKDLEERVG